MNFNKKFKTAFYVLISLSLLFLIAYLVVAFFPVFNVNGTSINLFNSAFVQNGLNSNPLILISFLTYLLGFLFIFIAFIYVLLSTQKKKMSLLFLVLSSPFLAFTFAIDMCLYQIFSGANPGVDIDVNLTNLMLLDTFLLLSLLSAVVSIFVYAFGAYRYHKFERNKKEKDR